MQISKTTVEASVVESAVTKMEEAKEVAIKTLVQDDEEDEDSCPIEPLVNDTDEEDLPLDNVQVAKTTIEASVVKSAVTKMEEAKGVANKTLVQEEEEDEDSCPIEPFLEEIDTEETCLSTTSLIETNTKIVDILDKLSTMVNNNSDKIQAQLELLNAEDAKECQTVLTNQEPKTDQNIASKQVESAATAKAEIPIESKDEENAKQMDLKELNGDSGKIKLFMEEEESDDDSCPIEPFMEDSDGEEAIKVEKAKSWADIASSAKPEPLPNKTEEKEAMVSAHHLPTILAVEEEKNTITGVVDPEGFKEVFSKKDRKRTRTLSSKSIQDAFCNMSTNIEVKELKTDETNESSQDIVEGRAPQEKELPVSWAKVVTSVIPSTQAIDEPTKTQVSETSHIPDILVITGPDTNQSRSWSDIDEDGFKTVHSKVEKRRSGSSFKDKNVETETAPDQVVKAINEKVDLKEAKDEEEGESCEDVAGTLPPAEKIEKLVIDEKESKEEEITSIFTGKNTTANNVQEINKVFEVEDSKTASKTICLKSADINTNEDKQIEDSGASKLEGKEESITRSEQTAAELTSSGETSGVTSLWAKVAALPAAVIKAACEETKTNAALNQDSKVPEIIVPSYMQEPILKVDETDSEGFKPVHSKKDRKRTHTISLKSVEKALEESQAFETAEHVDSVEGASISIPTTSSSAVVEETCTSSSWAKIAAIQPTLKMAIDAESKDEQKLDKDTKIPEVVVPVDEPETNDSDDIANVDPDGFKVVHAKRDRNRTRTLSLKSSTEDIEATKPVVVTDTSLSENKVQPIPVIDTQIQPSSQTKPEVKGNEKKEEDSEANFQIKASKSLSVPVAEACKPPDPYKYLSLEHVWVNKLDCEEAEIKWHTQKSIKTEEVKVPEKNEEHDDKGPKPGKGGGGGGNGSDRQAKKSGNMNLTGKTQDTSSDHPKGKGNWSDESTYLRLDPLAKVLSDSDTSDPENYDSGYNSLRRGEGTLKLSSVVLKEETKKKIVVKVEAELPLSSPLVDKFKVHRPQKTIFVSHKI